MKFSKYICVTCGEAEMALVKTGSNVVYTIGKKIYINLTNKCCCSCVFCVRNFTDTMAGVRLFFDGPEPSSDEVKKVLMGFPVREYEEIVFCGFGEPFARFEELLELVRFIKEQFSNMPVRINTNGLGDLINDMDTLMPVIPYIDSLSVSLNAQNPDVYALYTRPRYDSVQAYRAVLGTIETAVKAGLSTTATIVYGRSLSEIDIVECEKICQDLQAGFRIRYFD